MVVTCILCKITAKKSKQSISFHTLSIEDNAKQNWMKALDLTNVADSSRICSKHFSATDFQSPLTGSKGKLKKDAVPSLQEISQYIHETGNIGQEEERHVKNSTVVKKAHLKRSTDTVNDDDIPYAKYLQVGDIDVEKVCTSPTEAKLCLEMAIETIEAQRMKIHKLQTSNNKLRKSVPDLRELLGELKNKIFLSSEACEILDNEIILTLRYSRGILMIFIGDLCNNQPNQIFDAGVH